MKLPGTEWKALPSIAADAAGNLVWEFSPGCFHPIGITAVYAVDAATDRSSPTITLEVYVGATCGHIGYWKMDEVSGSTVADSSPQARHGVATGTTVVAGVDGNARSGAATGEEIVFPSGTLPSTHFTLMMWIKIFDDTVGHNLYFHGPQSGCNPSSSWFSAFGGGSPIRLAHGVGCADTYSIIGVGELTLGTWHLVGFTTDSSKRTTLFLDGVPQNSPADDTNGNALGSGNDTIGGTWSGGTLYRNMGYVVDEVRIYDHVLTSAEILSMSSGSP